ncbi:bZIP transcription factor [Halomontanus rarus]|uniref:bZIP transcription factor n=1 Tax=Halomontanus rarus TaxID=3034020 RepID=UPI0023E7ECAE|nr:bZIP transcription factor [Halovivax sp. TS33]
MSNADYESDDSSTETDDRDQDRERNRDQEIVRLTARNELLSEENERLRSEYARARRSQYRTSATALAGLGTLALVGGLLLPDARETLFVLAAIGLFVGVVTYYLTPTQFVSADVGERVYANLAANEAAIAGELGLYDQRLYLPGDELRRGILYVPQHPEFELPADPDTTFLTARGERGIALETTGSALFEEFERTLTAELASTPVTLASQVVDGLVEQFELARSVDSDVDAEAGRATFAVDGSAFGDVDRFDHPIASFLAVSFAVGLDRPITLEVAPAEGGADWLVTCRWEPDSDSESASAGEQSSAETGTGTSEEMGAEAADETET